MSKSKEIVVTVPLHGFDSDEKLIKLDGQTCLRFIDSEELDTLVVKNRNFLGMSLELAHHLSVKYVIERRTESDTPWECVDDVVLALRLLKRGEVAVSAAFWENGVIMKASLNPKKLQSASGYFLKNEDLKNLGLLWSGVRKLSEKPYLDFAIRNFMDSYDEGYIEDRIVDLMSAFESLVFNEEEKAIEPAGKVFGISIGLMLGRNQEERRKIKSDFIEAYKIRSFRIHGNMEKLRRFDLNSKVNLSDEIEEYLRRTLKILVGEPT